MRYFRPPLFAADIFKPVDEETKNKIRREQFPGILPEGKLIFGFVGGNQIRKDVPKVLRAFIEARKVVSNIAFYLHTDVDEGPYNLMQMLKDFGARKGDFVRKNPGIMYDLSQMARIYGGLDCLVNCSMQEGLSWTPLEAMACGIPIIASDTTAQTELVRGVGRLVPCTETSYVPVLGETGEVHVEAKSCSIKDIKQAIIDVAKSKKLRERMSRAGITRAKNWLKGVSNVNDLLNEMVAPVAAPVPVSEKIKKVLFAQHSAAGDVLMTTRCMKGVAELYGLPLDYMTSPEYMPILEGNPYIDNVIPWDEGKLLEYLFVCNPHGDRILPGHWGRNCNSILSDFYWKILMIKPTDFYVKMKAPRASLRSKISRQKRQKKICVVHTTGGDPHYRTYKFMADVCEGLKERYCTVQLGGENDYPAGAEVDARGLTFKESAWIMNRAMLTVAVDSYITHLAGALGVSQVALFGSGNAVVVRPNQVRGMLICRSPDYATHCKGLGPCSANVRDCPVTCTGLHDPKDILADIKEVEKYRRRTPKVIMKTSGE